MSVSTIERRLAAILAADIVGYSRLMRSDELDALQARRTSGLGLGSPAITLSVHAHQFRSTDAAVARAMVAMGVKS